jgi:ABC-type anion transport system duplicated permease subunit
VFLNRQKLKRSLLTAQTTKKLKQINFERNAKNILSFVQFSSEIRNNEKNCLFVQLARQIKRKMLERSESIQMKKDVLKISAHIDSQTIGITAAVFVMGVAVVCFIFILRRRRKKGEIKF